MPGVCRIGDQDDDDDSVVQGSPNVLINGLPVARVLIDQLSDGSTIITGDPKFIVNGFSVGRVGDQTSADNTMISGSLNVSSGGELVVVSANTTDQLSKNEVYHLLDVYNQPTTTRVQASEQHSDDQGADPIYGQYVQYAEADAGLGVPSPQIQQVAPAPGPPVNPPVPTDCMDIYSSVSFPDSFPLSTHFTLGQLSTHTLVSNYTVQAQVGLTVQDIVCNLRSLCINVLEPLYATYGTNMIINSGFRIGFGPSQHYRGQAADISFLDAETPTLSFARAEAITNNFIYDQFIYEQNLSIWLHVSWNQSVTPRRQILSKPRGTTYFPGLIRIQG